MANGVVRIHVENDLTGPSALRLTKELFYQEVSKIPGLRERISVSFNDDPAQMTQCIAGANVLLACRKLSLAEARGASPGLKWVQVISAGVEDYLKAIPSDLMLTNASGVHGPKGSQFILTSVLMLNFQIPRFVTAKERKEWSPVYGGILVGKTITLLGVGAIGKAAAALLRSFHVKLIGVTRSGRSECEIDQCVGIEDLDSVIAETNILVSTLPLTKETRALVDRRRINLLPHGAGVVVVGRADVFDYSALTERLRDESLCGAVLDVFPKEPVPTESELWNCPRLIITPHCSIDDHGSYMLGCLEIFIDNLGRFLSELPLRNIVDHEHGY